MPAQSNDLLLIQRGGVFYKVTADEIAALGGGGLTQGAAILDFGAFPGSNTASVIVTGLTGIAAVSQPKAYVSANATTGDHTANDHKYFAYFVGLSCGDIVAATSLTIHAVSAEKLQGQWSINYEF